MTLKSFVPMEKRLLSDPLLKTMAEKIEKAKHAANYEMALHLAIGVMVGLWATGDDHADEDGFIAFTASQLEKQFGFNVIPFLPPRWFIQHDDGRFQLPNFWSKNGLPAKYRARENQNRAARREAEKIPQPVESERKESGAGAEKIPHAPTAPHTPPIERKESGTVAEKIPQGGRNNSALRSDPIRSDPIRTDPDRMCKSEPDTHTHAGSVADEHQFGAFLRAYPAHTHLLKREMTLEAALHLIRSRKARWADLIRAAAGYARWCESVGKTGTDFVVPPLNFLQRGVWREDFDAQVSATGSAAQAARLLEQIEADERAGRQP